MIDCAAVKAAGTNACDTYQKFEAKNNEDGDVLGNFRAVDGNFGLDYICQKDPCGAAAVEGKSACTFKENIIAADTCE